LDLKQIDAMSSEYGKKKDFVNITVTGKMIDVARKTDVLLIKRDFMKKSVGVWSYSVAWKRSVAVRRLVTPSVSPVTGPLLRRTAWRKKLASETAGHIDLRCSLASPPVIPPAADLLMQVVIPLIFLRMML
jgi:hypothetical protein